MSAPRVDQSATAITPSTPTALKKTAPETVIDRPDYPAGGRPTCEKTDRGLIWKSHEKTLPLVIRSTVPNVKSITSSDLSGYIYAHISNGALIVIGAKPNLPPQTDQECLKQLPIPNFLPDAVKKAAFWRFGDSNATSATRRIELVVETHSRTNPQRVIAVGGLLFWVNNTPTTSGAVFVLGVPDYRRFNCISNFASPHTPGPTEIQLMYEVGSVGEIAARMILEDISLPEKPRN